MSHHLLAHPSISRRHAAIIYTRDGGIALLDCGSAHGTYLQGKRVASHAPAALQDGCEVKFGDSSRLFVLRLSSQQRKRSQDPSVDPATKRLRDDKPTSEMPKQVRCLHILAKHRGSRRPSSWREDRITRSRDEAIARITALRKKITSGEATFEEVAQSESDCSSAKRGGDLGKFGRGTMQPPFEQAAFSLQVIMLNTYHSYMLS